MADDGLRDRLARQGEDALGKLAQDLLENPLVNGAITPRLRRRASTRARRRRPRSARSTSRRRPTSSA